MDEASVSEEVWAGGSAPLWAADGGARDLDVSEDILILQRGHLCMSTECPMRPSRVMDILMAMATERSILCKHLAGQNKRNKTRRPNEKQIQMDVPDDRTARMDAIRIFSRMGGKKSLGIGTGCSISHSRHMADS